MSDGQLSKKIKGQIFRDLLSGDSVEALAERYHVEKSVIKSVRSEAELATRVYAPRGWAMDLTPPSSTPRSTKSSWRHFFEPLLRRLRARVKTQQKEPRAVRENRNQKLIDWPPPTTYVVFGAVIGWFVIVAAEKPELQVVGIFAGGVVGRVVFGVEVQIQGLREEVRDLKTKIDRSKR